MKQNLKISRFDIYKNESQIESLMTCEYNNTMSHRMKEKDTFKTIFPTSDLWKNDLIFKTTNTEMKADSFTDPYLDDRYFFKMDINKKYTEEMLKAKNMTTKKKKESN